EAIGEGGDLAKLAVVAGVAENADAVALVALVIGGPLVRVVLDDPDAALLIDGQASRRDDVRLLGDQLDDEPLIGDTRRRGPDARGEQQDEKDGEKAARRHDGRSPGTMNGRIALSKLT